MQKTGLVSTVTLFLTAAFSMMSAMDALAALPKKTFVLVHGAFADQSVWDGPNPGQGVAEQLRQRGYRVVTVTLPGMGRDYGQTEADVNYNSASIDLNAHVNHVADVLKMDNVTDAIMVCHSYAGMVCAGVQDRDDVKDRIDKMVFFDAVVPESGQSFFDAVGMPSPDVFPSLEVFYQTLGIVPEENLSCFPNKKAQDFNLFGADADWLDARHHCQPVHTLDQKLNFSWNNDVRKYFVHAEDNNNPTWFAYYPFSAFPGRAAAMGWNLYSIPNSHYTFISHPDDTVQLLMLIDSIPYENWPFSMDVTQL